MKIYKFKNFAKKEEIDYFCQIFLHKTMWCAKPDSLNDHAEFEFELNYKESKNTLHLLADINAEHIKSSPYLTALYAMKSKSLQIRAEPVIRSLIADLKNDLGIASFTLTNQESYLWNMYGGKGNGACVVI